MKKNWMKVSITLCVGFTALFLVLNFMVTTTSAAERQVRQLCYESIQIREGDSLWSIAEENYSEDYASVAAYVKDIARANGIREDSDIHAGEHLILPYYEDMESASL